MAGNMTLSDKKSLAQDMYLNTDKTQKEIAEILKITEKTLGKWKTVGDWELLKQAGTITAKNIIANLYQKAYDESTKDSIDADKMIKIANSIEKLNDRKVTISHVINVFKDFTNWAFENNPILAKEINVLQKDYVDYKVNER